MHLWIIFWILGLTVTTFVGAWVIRKYRDTIGYAVLTTFFALYVLSANILVPRLVTLGNLGTWVLVAVTGTVIWPFTSQIIDMINEVYGRKRAYVSVATAYGINLVFVSFVFMGFYMKPLWSSANEEFFRTYFAVAPRVLAASGIAFLVENFVDIRVFSKLKEFFRRREEFAISRNGFAWLPVILRSLTSDSVSMVLDALIFTTLAFAFSIPGSILLSLIGTTMVIKLILTTADTPFYIAYRWLVRGVKRDV